MTPGYSTTPLLKKLGIKAGFRCIAINSPPSYFEWLDELPEGAHFEGASSPYDFIHWFVTTNKELSNDLADHSSTLLSSGVLWVSWPKGSSGIPTNINRDLIRTHLLQNSDLVDIKVCAVSDDWSGLKFMIRKEKR